MMFRNWMKEVDECISRVAGGLVSDDLADQTWRDWYDDEYTPEEAGAKALENEGYEE